MELTDEGKQMAAGQPAGAPSHETEDWHAIDWRAVHRTVKRLQARIVQATKAGKWGKVKALQRLLTHSFSAKAMAVKRVTENHGKRQVHSREDRNETGSVKADLGSA